MNSTPRIDRPLRVHGTWGWPVWVEALAYSFAVRWVVALLYVWLTLFVFSTLETWSKPGLTDAPDPRAPTAALVAQAAAPSPAAQR
jgi:hypothetical protein